MNVFLRVLGFQKNHLGNDQARHHIVDCGADKNDPLFKQPGKDIESALTAACLFDNHRNELVVKVVRFVRMNHCGKSFLRYWCKKLGQKLACIVCDRFFDGRILLQECDQLIVQYFFAAVSEDL